MKRNKQEYYDKMGLNKKDVKLLNDYFAAFSNLYGKISLRTAFEIINEQNDNRFSEDALLKFAKSKNREKRFYMVLSQKEFYDDIDHLEPLDDEIVNDALCSVNDDGYYELDEAQEGKPICVLPKEELLRYADDYYREDTPETRALEKYLERNARILQPPASSGYVNTARDLVDEYVLAVNLDFGFESMNIDDLLRLVDMPDDDREYEKFLKSLLPLANDVHNNTRMWVNRGYTPRELSVLMGGPKPENLRFFTEPL